MKRRQSTDDLSRKVPAIERFLAFVAPQPNGCWLWTGTVTVRGYGYFSTGVARSEGPDMMSAHRWAYQFWIGPIPAGKQLDHTCHRECVGGDLCPHRRCVNPDHLEPVTNRENVVRGNAARITSSPP